MLLLALSMMVTCRGTESSLETDSDSADQENSLLLDKTSLDFSQNPLLLQRILSSPHGYFRFINIPFSQEVCRAFEEVLPPYPDFNLHGDAHLEQYAVTDLGRGLTDFDDSTLGPSLIDITRFAVSLRLAAEANGWESKAEEFFDGFLEGYLDALTDPQTVASEPAVVARLREDFNYDRERYFNWIGEIAKPIPRSEQQALLEALELYVEDVRARRPELGPNYFDVERIGRLKLGIGSAMDRKYLVQIRGETADISDDVVLELKTVRNLTGIDCVSTGQTDDPYRILIGQSIAYQPYELLGYVRFDGSTFWIHAWVDNYRELSVVGDLRTPDELMEVARDVGVQLGRGHPNQLREPLDLQLRREQVRLLARDRELIRSTSRRLAAQVQEAWRHFGRDQ